MRGFSRPWHLEAARSSGWTRPSPMPDFWCQKANEVTMMNGDPQLGFVIGRYSSLGSFKITAKWLVTGVVHYWICHILADLFTIPRVLVAHVPARTRLMFTEASSKMFVLFSRIPTPKAFGCWQEFLYSSRDFNNESVYGLPLQP